METYILQENVLTDNLLHIAPNGKIFKGGFIAIIEEWFFQNSWSDRKELKRFRSEKSLQKYLSKSYPNFNFYQ